MTWKRGETRSQGKQKTGCRQKGTLEGVCVPVPQHRPVNISGKIKNTTKGTKNYGGKREKRSSKGYGGGGGRKPTGHCDITRKKVEREAERTEVLVVGGKARGGGGGEDPEGLSNGAGDRGEGIG